jgi:hypothetical protein
LFIPHFYWLSPIADQRSMRYPFYYICCPHFATTFFAWETPFIL